jgi:phosphoglycerol transferase
VDIYPTLLDWLDLLAPGETRAGLGRSLLADEPSLVQYIGFDTLNATLRVDTALAQHLWRNAETPAD